MVKQSKFLPVFVVLMVVGVIGMVMATERTNAPGISGDDRYPHQICTFNRYCRGDICTDGAFSVIAYFEHETGEPRLEVPGMATQATIEERDDRIVFTSTGGDVKGNLAILRNRTLDLYATEEDGPDLIEHFASGTCDRPVLP